MTDEDTQCATADFIGLLNSRLGLLHGAAGVGVIGVFFEVTPDITLLGFPSGTFLFICVYIYWFKRLYTE
jgi:CBS domain containing-hemolysin-like protein